MKFKNLGFHHLKDGFYVEASPYDRVWGIGFQEAHALDNIERWGLNLLGKALNRLYKNLNSFVFPDHIAALIKNS